MDSRQAKKEPYFQVASVADGTITRSGLDYLADHFPDPADQLRIQTAMCELIKDLYRRGGVGRG